MNCPNCSNRMGIRHTYRALTYTNTRYGCFTCGHQEKVRAELPDEEETPITQARISMPYEDFITRINGLIPREPMPMRILLARRSAAELHEGFHGGL